MENPAQAWSDAAPAKDLHHHRIGFSYKLFLFREKTNRGNLAYADLLLQIEGQDRVADDLCRVLQPCLFIIGKRQYHCVDNPLTVDDTWQTEGEVIQTMTSVYDS